jgi:hypothetical protein
MIRENAWRRGWRDTRSAWKDWRFLVWEVAVSPITGVILGLTVHPAIGGTVTVAMVLSVLVGVWVGATVRAPYKQRDEAIEFSEQYKAGLEAEQESKITAGRERDDERKARSAAEKQRDNALERLAILESIRPVPGLLVSRAHISFQNGLPEFVNSHNVSSVTDAGIGMIMVVWMQDYADSEYDVNLNVKGGHAELDSVSPGSVTIRTFAYGGTPEDAQDVMEIRVSALGDYASTPSIAGTEGSPN